MLMPVAGAHAQTDRVLVPADDPSGGAADQSASSNAALADNDSQAPIPFEGGQLTITQQEEYGEKVLAFDGKQLASNYDVFFDKVVKVGGVDVALVDVGDGGNQCGPAKLIVWKPEGGTIQSTTVEQDECGAPPAAVSDYAIYFVPYLLPGDSKPALQWSPTGGLSTSGNLTYTPEPGTDWKDVDPAKYDSIVDAHSTMRPSTRRPKNCSAIPCPKWRPACWSAAAPRKRRPAPSTPPAACRMLAAAATASWRSTRPSTRSISPGKVTNPSRMRGRRSRAGRSM